MDQYPVLPHGVVGLSDKVLLAEDWTVLQPGVIREDLLFPGWGKCWSTAWPRRRQLTLE